MTKNATIEKKYINSPNKRVHHKGDIFFYVALLAIPLIQLGIFYFGVNIQSILMAFQKYDAYNNKFIFDVSANWNEFMIAVKSKDFWIMFKNSIIVWIAFSLSGTVLAVFFSYYIYKRRTLCNVFKFVLFLPSIIPSVLLVIMGKNFFSSTGLPVLTESYLGFKFPNFFETPQSQLIYITIFSIWISFGSQVLVYTGAMDQIPTEITEAAKLDGASSFREFLSIIVPLILPTVSTFIVAGIAGIFTNQCNLYSFCGSGADPSIRNVGYYMYICIQDSNVGGISKYCYISFLGLLFSAITVPLAFGVKKLLEKVTK